MPHMNVLNFAVFPANNRRHKHLISYLRGMLVSKEDDIWKIAAKVWEELSSCKIANKFCLTKMIAEKL